MGNPPAPDAAPATSLERELVIAMHRAGELGRDVADAVGDAVSRSGVLDGSVLEDARAAAGELYGALGMASEITRELRTAPAVDVELVDALDGDLDDALALARATSRILARAQVSQFARERAVVFVRELNHALDRAFDDELALCGAPG